MPYDPSVFFDVHDLTQAKQIILTPTSGQSTNERWLTETPYLLSLIKQHMMLNEKSIVLDYGCGCGRMAKALIEGIGCRVVGVDISPNMRALAASYVKSDRFLACAPEWIEHLGMKFNGAVAVWVLQHCAEVEADIANITKSLRYGARVLIVNDLRRLVPTNRNGGWTDDGKNVRGLLQEGLNEIENWVLDPNQVGAKISDASYYSIFSKQEN